MKEGGISWLNTVSKLWSKKLDQLQSPNSQSTYEILNPDNNSDERSFRKSSACSQPKFKVFNFEKEKQSFLKNLNVDIPSHELAAMVSSFKLRVNELKENIDEDFIANVRESVIPDQDEKINNFLEESAVYLRSSTNKALFRNFYIENFIYKKEY